MSEKTDKLMKALKKEIKKHEKWMRENYKRVNLAKLFGPSFPALNEEDERILQIEIARKLKLLEFAQRGIVFLRETHPEWRDCKLESIMVDDGYHFLNWLKELEDLMFDDPGVFDTLTEEDLRARWNEGREQEANDDDHASLPSLPVKELLRAIGNMTPELFTNLIDRLVSDGHFTKTEDGDVELTDKGRARMAGIGLDSP
jgi:hypothetical protein